MTFSIDGQSRNFFREFIEWWWIVVSRIYCSSMVMSLWDIWFIIVNYYALGLFEPIAYIYLYVDLPLLVEQLALWCLVGVSLVRWITWTIDDKKKVDLYILYLFLGFLFGVQGLMVDTAKYWKRCSFFYGFWLYHIGSNCLAMMVLLCIPRVACVSVSNNPDRLNLLNGLPMVSLTDLEKGNGPGPAISCRICLQDFQEEERMRKLNCSHVFHETCLRTWVVEYNHTTCPLCNQPITSNQ